jgi:hypothetical protein
MAAELNRPPRIPIKEAANFKNFLPAPDQQNQKATGQKIGKSLSEIHEEILKKSQTPKRKSLSEIHEELKKQPQKSTVRLLKRHKKI